AVPAAYAPRLSATLLSAQPNQDPTAFGGRRFWDALGGAADVTPVASQAASYEWRVYRPRAEALDRMASVAALQALDAETSHSSTISTLLQDPRTYQCVDLTQLQLIQCMSAARFRYEHTFCLANHGLREVGQCIASVAEPSQAAMTTGSHGGGRP
ncbi:MAG TPA: hypothetical protein PLK37_08455, partial [Terricaulis sp.]|nr:hypothetical protein [Terricaulis sp.]